MFDGCQDPGLVRWLRNKRQQLALVELGTFSSVELEGVDAAEQAEAICCDGRAPEPMLRVERYFELWLGAG